MRVRENHPFPNPPTESAQHEEDRQEWAPYPSPIPRVELSSLTPGSPEMFPILPHPHTEAALPRASAILALPRLGRPGPAGLGHNSRMLRACSTFSTGQRRVWGAPSPSAAARQSPNWAWSQRDKKIQSFSTCHKLDTQFQLQKKQITFHSSDTRKSQWLRVIRTLKEHPV